MCVHPPTGKVSCSPDESNYASSPVCSELVCISEASAWVKRLTGKPPVYERRGDAQEAREPAS